MIALIALSRLIPMEEKPQNQKEGKENMNSLTHFKIRPLLIVIAVALVFTRAVSAVTLPPGNTVQQWNKIAEDTVVGSGAFQAEGFIYMAYVSAAVYDATVAIEGGFEPVRSADHSANRGISRLRNHRGQLPHAPLLLLVISESRDKPQ